MEQIGEAWDRIERTLAGGGPDMLGDRFSATDLPMLMLSHWRQAQPDMLSRPKGLGRLADLVFVRPAVRRALEQNQPAA
jgi:hypothetical protein